MSIHCPNTCSQRTKWTILNAKNFRLEVYFYLDILYKHKLYFHPMALTPSPLNYSRTGSTGSQEQLSDGEMTTSHGAPIMLNFPLLYFIVSLVRFRQAL